MDEESLFLIVISSFYFSWILFKCIVYISVRNDLSDLCKDAFFFFFSENMKSCRYIHSIAINREMV